MAKFNRIFVEKDVIENTYTQYILNKLKRSDFEEIDKIETYFNRVKKPYLQKRENLNLFIGKKVGVLIKEAPNAYGVIGEKHFYYIHAYNCIYECHYCYLQGYFNSPDLVLFVNHYDICNAIEDKIKDFPNENIWFHGGEFSDSLALNAITDELEIYWHTFKKNSKAFLELRTKSANIASVIKYEPLANIIISFSLSPAEQIEKFDAQTATLKARLAAINKLSKLGFRIGIHLDPVIYNEYYKQEYIELLTELMQNLDENLLKYMSIGVVRFSKDVYLEVQRNYPSSSLLNQEFIKSFDGKIRYTKPHRLQILNTIKEIAINSGIKSNKIYFCMED